MCQLPCLCQAEIKRGKGRKPEKPEEATGCRTRGSGESTRALQVRLGVPGPGCLGADPTSLLTRCVIRGKLLSFSVLVSLCVHGNNGTYAGPGL